MALALLLGFWWTTRSAGRETPPPVATAAPPEAAATVAAAPALPPEDELPEPIRRYLDATPYPQSSGLLTPAHEDLLRPNERHERPRPIPETLGDPNGVATTLFTADHYYYNGDEVVHAWLEGRQRGKPLLLRVLDATARAEGRSGPEGAATSLHFVAEGDRLTAELPLARFADHHGPIVLEVLHEWAPGSTQEESLRLFHTRANRVPARLTGEFRDSLSGGSLRLDVGIEVDQPGFYRLDGNLYDAAGRPVAFAVFKGELDRADRAVPLEVYGKVLRDAAAPGPWTLTQLRGYRFLEGGFPDREIVPEHPGAWRTREYSLDAFLDTPHVSAHERHVVQLMLDDLARGISLDVPPPPTAAPEALPTPPTAPASPPPE